MDRERLFEIPSRALTLVENALYRDRARSAAHDLVSLGHCRMQSTFPGLADLLPEAWQKRNPYMHVRVYSRQDLARIVETVLGCGETRDLLQDAFGMRFAVDYIYSSEIHPIPDELRHVGYYANHFHRDTMFSSNTVKIFIALADIGENQGPTEWLSKPDSDRLMAAGFTRGALDDNIAGGARTLKFVGKRGDAIMMNPRTNIHRAGVPEAGRTRSQMMLQLNPSRDWAVHEALYERQFAREPNLPLLRSIGKRHPVPVATSAAA